MIGVALAWFFPPAFTWMTDGRIAVAGQPLLSLALGVIMLAMGLTLTFDDYRKLAAAPRALVAGVALQFAVMPLTGFAIARGLALEPGLAVGLILVACCPGGTASNIVTFLARGNVALSVVMTMASTLAAVVLTPLLTGWLAGAYVEIDRLNLLLNMVSIVLVPVVLGTLLNRLFPRVAERVSAVLPLVAIVLVILIVGGIVGGAKAQIARARRRAAAGDLPAARGRFCAGLCAGAGAGVGGDCGAHHFDRGRDAELRPRLRPRQDACLCRAIRRYHASRARPGAGSDFGGVARADREPAGGVVAAAGLVSGFPIEGRFTFWPRKRLDLHKFDDLVP